LSDIFKGFRGLNRSTEFPSVCATCTQKRCKIQKAFKAIAKAGILEAELVVIKCENHELNHEKFLSAVRAESFVTKVKSLE
jgi:hypothetical protein